MNLSPAGAHLLDTSAIILLIRHRLSASTEALIPFAALGELNVGVFRVDHPERELVRVHEAIAPAIAIFATEETTFHYGRIVAQLQRAGELIPINDIWNAAQAIEHNVPLLGDDRHFHRVPGLRYVPVR